MWNVSSVSSVAKPSSPESSSPTTNENTRIPIGFLEPFILPMDKIRCSDLFTSAPTFGLSPRKLAGSLGVGPVKEGRLAASFLPWVDWPGAAR